MTCPNCNALNSMYSANCTTCGAKLPQPYGDRQSKQIETQKDSKSSAGVLFAGFICALISLAIFPPLFGILGIIFGIIAVVRGSVMGGMFIILLCVGCMMWGMNWGAQVGQQNFLKSLKQR